MAEPNADDGLMPEIVRPWPCVIIIIVVKNNGADGVLCVTNLGQANTFKHDRELFNKKAAGLTE